MNKGKSNRSGQAASSSVLSPMPARDLVTAKMTVSAPHGGFTLTGGSKKIEVTGKNTGWAKGPGADATVSRYSARKSYLQENHGGHEFPKAIMARHVESPSGAEDKRGVSCAEGHSVIESHKKLTQAGKDFAASNLDAFQRAWVPMPTFSPNAKRAHKNTMLARRDAQLLNLLKETTGAESWETYVTKEASQLAWGDIQRHGTISDVRHDERSDVNAGHSMEYCVQCRKEIADNMKK